VKGPANEGKAIAVAENVKTSKFQNSRRGKGCAPEAGNIRRKEESALNASKKSQKKKA